MFSFLRKTTTRTTSKRQQKRTTRPSRIAKTWLTLDRLEAREVPAVFTVTNLGDGVVSGPGQLPGSLRQAIFDANALPGADTINFSVGSGTLTMIAGEFKVTDSVNIIGPGSSQLTIDASSFSRHFNVSDDTVAQITVSMSGMKLINGQAPDPATGISGSGGSIFGRNEILILESMIITGNKTSNVVGVGRPSGGAISMGDAPIPTDFSGLGSTLLINNCLIENNFTANVGGGIGFQFPNNLAGGVGNVFAITNSTVANNIAARRGGGIYFSGNAGAGAQLGSSFSMRNTTVSGNRSQLEFGGGVQINSTTGLPMSILNSTITNNTAMTTPGGGGLVLNTGTGTLNIENTIISGNFGPAFAPEIFTNSGATINSRNNIFGSLAGLNSATYLKNLGGTIIGSANLGPLTNNGGITLTHMPSYNSPAINPPLTVTATTLTVATNNGNSGTPADNSLTVANNAGLAVGTYIRIDSEVMFITGLSGMTGVTVNRAQNGTSSATHAIGRAVNNGTAAITTLTAAAALGASTVTVTSSTNLVVGSIITIDSETVQIGAINSSTVTLTAPLASAHEPGAGVNSVSSVQTTLGPAILAGDTNVFVSSTVGIVPNTKLQINSEIVKVDKVSSTALTTLAAPMTSSGSSLTVASTANLSVGLNVTIDFENVRVTAITNIATTLAAAITDPAAQSCVVTSATGITTNMLLLIDAEYVLVTGISGTILTIVRGQNGTAATTHGNGASVTSATITVQRGQLGTSSVVHNSGVSLAAPTLTIVRGQDSTVAAGHSAGQALMLAYDQLGNARRQGSSIDIGAVEVNVATPAAIATVSNITVAGGTTGTFTVTYTSNTAIDVMTIKNNNAAVRVTGPGGFDVAATYVMLDNDTVNGSPRTATYTFAAPGTWDDTDNGTYSIVVQPNQVKDVGMTPVPSAAVGRFQVAIGRNFVVTTPFDGGPGSLRDAIDMANMNVGVADTITFDTITMGSTTAFVSGTELVITDPIVIIGSGVTVDGGGVVRLFRSSGPGNMAISMSDLNIANGVIPGIITDPNIGGGILGDDDNWTLTNCMLTGNTGGAVALNSVVTWGSLTLVNCVIDNNMGGGVISSGLSGHDISIQNSSITNNTGSGFSGRTFSFNMANSTIANNTGALRGGGINIVGFFNSNGNSIINSTITGNSAMNSGAGIYMYWAAPTSSSRVLIANTTIAGNFSVGGFQNEPGGGINNRATTNYLVDFENCVIAGNTNGTVPDFNSKSKVVANNSFIGIYQPSNGAVVGVNNQLGSKSAPLDPFLAPLANNGGTTLTRAPYAGSPLVDVSVVTPILGTLTADLAATSTSATVNSTAGFAVGMYVRIDSEIAQVTGITNPTTLALGSFFASGRGLLGTTAANHTTGATLTIAYTQPANDQRGAGFPRAANGKVDIGAIEVDPNIPAAVLTAPIPAITTPGQTSTSISITFTDNVAIDVTTIKNNNNVIRVTGPNGFNTLATYVSMDNDTVNGTPRTAIFKVDAPGGSWDLSENGYYTISIEPMQVSDTSANFVQAHTIGQFRVAFTLNLVVTNDNDSGTGSLRNALDQANANADVADFITFDPGFFNTPRTIQLLGGELPITDAVTITGPGAKFATIQGISSRIFTIDTPTIQAPVSISGLTMTGGNGQTIIDAGVTPGGGAILNVDESLTINGCIITKNDTSGTGTTAAYGGGILLGNALATLTLQNSTLSYNSAGQSGGGLSVRYGCLVTIDNCIISNNVALSTGGSGGGISAELGSSGGSTPTPTVTLTNSTVSNNTAASGGGVRVGNGIAQNTRVAFFTAVNTTFSGNVANGSSSGFGGALNIGNFTNVTIQNCTISGNYALNGGGGVNFAANIGNTNAVNAAFINTIIAGNINRVSPDVGGAGSTTTWALPFVNSIVGAVDTSVTKINNIGSQIGTLAAPINPFLSPLTTNGTAALVQMPKPGSTAINAGTTTPNVILTTLSAAATDVATTISVSAAGALHIGLFVQVDSEIMQVVSVSGTTVTVTRGQLSTTAAAHNLGANVSRGETLPPPANDQRGAGFPRQIGTIDIGAVEVNPAIPVAAGTFATISAPTMGVQTLVITFTDDVGMNMASIIGNNNAVRITGPNGFNTLATYVSATPGTGAKVETVTYSFLPPGGGWDNGEDGFYTVSIEPTQISDGTNFVYTGTVNTLHVAIPRTFVVDVTFDDDDGNYTPGNLSIREAIKLANENSGVRDIITFSPSVFMTPQIIQLFSGPLTITDPVTITGPGKLLATIDGLNIGRLMFIDLAAGTWGDPVSISGLTFANGNSSPSLAGAAAGITNYTANLTLDNVDMTGMVTNSSGGAIGLSSFWAGLTLTNSKIFNNTANNGAGVYIGNNSSALTTIPNTVQVLIQNTVFDLNNSMTSFTSNGGSGAGVYTLGGANVTIIDSEFTNNVVGTSGAAIFNNGAIMNIIRTNITNNSANNIATFSLGTGQGGGIFLGSTAGTNVTITNSTIAGNYAGDPTILSGVATSSGGGIFVSSGAILNVESSTLSGNVVNGSSTTSQGGAGIYLTGTAQVTVSNSTLSGNTAFKLGGGIAINSLTKNASPALAGSLVVRNSTIAYNTANGQGGGINFRTSTGTGTVNVSVTSSIVSENTSPVGADLNSATGNATTAFTVNNSFIGNLAGATITGANNKNTAMDGPVNLNPTLALNGAPVGSPLTHAFAGMSAAIDNGSNATPLSFDQRGTGFSRTVNNATDMGAFEVQNMTALPTVSSIQVNDGMSVQRSMVTSMTITFSAAVTFPNGISTAFRLIRTSAVGGGATGTVNVTGTGSGTNVITLTFVNGGDVTLDPAGSLPDGMYSLTLISNQIAGVGGFLDGNMNGTYQGEAIDNVTSTPFHRLFGDADGNGTVTASDFNAFRLFYGSPSFTFDYNGDGTVTAADFNAFRTRYGVSI